MLVFHFLFFLFLAVTFNNDPRFIWYKCLTIASESCGYFATAAVPTLYDED